MFLDVMFVGLLSINNTLRAFWYWVDFSTFRLSMRKLEKIKIQRLVNDNVVDSTLNGQYRTLVYHDELSIVNISNRIFKVSKSWCVSPYKSAMGTFKICQHSQLCWVFLIKKMVCKFIFIHFNEYPLFNWFLTKFHPMQQYCFIIRGNFRTISWFAAIYTLLISIRMVRKWRLNDNKLVLGETWYWIPIIRIYCCELKWKPTHWIVHLYNV